MNEKKCVLDVEVTVFSRECNGQDFLLSWGIKIRQCKVFTSIRGSVDSLNTRNYEDVSFIARDD